MNRKLVLKPVSSLGPKSIDTDLAVKKTKRSIFESVPCLINQNFGKQTSIATTGINHKNTQILARNRTQVSLGCLQTVSCIEHIPKFWQANKAIITGDDRKLLQDSSVSIVVSIPACHVGDLGSIPRRSDTISVNLEGEIPMTIAQSFLDCDAASAYDNHPIFFRLQCSLSMQALQEQATSFGIQLFGSQAQ